MKKITLLIAIAVSFTAISCKTENKETPAEMISEETASHQIVSLNGAIKEPIAGLGKGDQIVGRDVTSTYPAELTGKDLGHVGRNMTIEGIMAVNPSLIIGSENDSNPELMKRIEESGIKTEIISQEFSVDGAKNLIKKVAEIIGANEYQNLYDKIDADIALIQNFEKKPKVLFIY